jgi:DNA polymerase-3 subunit gamma/tau
VLYQKYRPQNFSQVFGNKEIVKSLQNALDKDNIGHAYLFHGPRGTGKTTMARILAKSLICDNYSKQNDACLTCDSCKEVSSGTYPDLIEIDAASNNSVENIRSINEKINLAPTKGKLKFYIIDEVHMLSKGAFNALLKTLEEPPKNTYFVLATTEPEKVIETVKSRCQQFEFKRANNKDIIEKLKFIVGSEKAKVSDSDIEKISKASRGGFRDAETLLETVITSGVGVDQALNKVGNDFSVRFFDSVLANDSKVAIELVNEVYESGKNLESWNKDLLSYLRNIMLLTQGLEDRVELEEGVLPLAKDQSGNFTRTKILKCLKAFNSSLENLKVAYVPTLPLELAVLEVTEISGERSGSTDPNSPDPKIVRGSEPVGSSSTSSSIKNTESAENQVETKDLNESTNESTAELKSEATQSFKAQDSKPTLKKDLPVKKPEPKTQKEQPDLTTKQPKDFSWADYKKQVKVVKPSVATILNSCKYSGFSDESLVIEAQFLFHKERLEMPSTQTILIEVAQNITGRTCSVQCILKSSAKKDLTDKNVQYVTINENDVPEFESSKPKTDSNGEFAIPANDPNFVASPVNVGEESSTTDNPGEALDAFSGEFTV